MPLYKNIEHVTILINRSPKIMALTVDRQKDFVHKPRITEIPSSMPNLIGVLLTELQTPLPYRLIGDHDTPSGKDLFDISVAQCKAEIQVDRVADDLGRIAIAGIGIG